MWRTGPSGTSGFSWRQYGEAGEAGDSVIIAKQLAATGNQGQRAARCRRGCREKPGGAEKKGEEKQKKEDQKYKTLRWSPGSMESWFARSQFA